MKKMNKNQPHRFRRAAVTRDQRMRPNEAAMMIDAIRGLLKTPSVVTKRSFTRPLPEG
jgi:outer membrane usher protein FimD/PapC